MLASALVLAPLSRAALCAPVSVEDDQFSKAATLIGPAQVENPFGGISRVWRIRSWVDKGTLKVAHQLYIDISFDSPWTWYDTAADDHANDMAVIRISKEATNCRGRCSRFETVGVLLDDSLLRSRVMTGFAIKLSSRNGDALILTISPEQIADTLRAVDAYQRAHGLPDQIAALAPLPSLPPPPLGIETLDYGSINRRLYFGLDRGLKVTNIDDGSVAAIGGIKRGDWLLDLGGTPLKSKADLAAALAAVRTGSSVLATIRHAGTIQTINLQF